MNSSLFLKIGFALLLFCPFYQLIDASLRNEEGDGVIVYGEHTLFAPLIGVRVDYYYLEPGYGWADEYSLIKTPVWMQSFGLPKLVTYGTSDVYYDKGSDFEKAIVFLVRTLIKLMIPGIFFLIAWLLKRD